ncbi:amino acid permease-domain-containing protein [Podospora aff. communis PSN243]|uniref:Amino acid permease-domain-containing protein n=1 Tax=Podospora aff. communis PSN243 TaxID=3040156 RepID=A0AAV9G722_9PEZI|nr:amino acid permease-domain-containing protein [Podospora aff. communis PSN243]
MSCMDTDCQGPLRVYRRDLPFETVPVMPNFATNSIGRRPPDTTEDADVFSIPEDRRLGVTSTALLIVNRMIGTGIFSTPSTIIQATNSVGAALLFWVLGGFMTLWMLAYLELGCAMPRSGGEKVYLEKIYQRPKYLATAVFAVDIIAFYHSAANSVNFASYILRTVHGLDTTLNHNCGRSQDGTIPTSPLSEEWTNKGISIMAVTLVCLILAFAPKTGIYLSNTLGFFKLGMLSVVVIAGFTALAGNMKAPRPDNFSTFAGAGDACPLSTRAYHNAPGSVANFALALIQVLYAYSGWENANYVLTEVRNAPKTLKRAAPLASFTVTALYILANISYFAASSKHDIANSGNTVFGSGVFVTRVLPFFISLSILGNLFSQAFAGSRGENPLLPFSKFFASDWPIKTPTGGLLLHWSFTIILIVGPRNRDAYAFIAFLYAYSQIWIQLMIACGLVYMTLSKNRGWKQERTSFHTSNYLTIPWALCLLYVLFAPFMENSILTPTIPWYVVPTVGCSIFPLGILYWVYWFRIWPLFGYSVVHEREILPDGSERIRYVHQKSRKPKSGAKNSRLSIH